MPNMGNNLGTAVFAVLLSLMAANAALCPSQCTCGPSNMIKGEVKTIRAECNVIPTELPHSIITLKVYNTQVHNITRDVLSGVVAQLVDIKLESLQIEHIADRAFQNAVHLGILRLSRNRLTAVTAHTFAGCTTLRELHLEENALSSVDDNAFATLVHLEELFLQENKLTWLPSHLPPNLVILDLSANKLGPSITKMSNLTHLALLNMCSNPFLEQVSAEALASLSSLKTLCLGGNNIRLPQSASDHLQGLKQLRLASNRFVQLDEVTQGELERLTNLKALELANFYMISSSFLEKMTSLRQIQLMNVSVSRTGGKEFIEFLPGLNLANIQLDRSPQLAKVFIENAHKFKFVHLNTLSLQSTGLTTLHPAGIPGENLPYLDISHNPFHCNCSLKWLQHAHDLQNKQDTLCATPDALRGTMLTEFVRQLNCSMEEAAAGGDDGTHSSGQHAGDDNTTNIIVGCVIAALLIVIIVLATVYILLRRKRFRTITPDTELPDQQQQQQVQTIRQAHSNDRLLNK